MLDMNHRHYDLCKPISPDDPRQFFFVRWSGLPMDYYKRHRMTPDAWVFIACAVGLIVLLIATKTF